jgi:hypothetical protein
LEQKKKFSSIIEYKSYLRQIESKDLLIFHILEASREKKPV